MRVELHVEIERLQDRDEKSRRDPMAGSVMCLGSHPMPLLLPNVPLEKPVKRQTYLVEQHAKTTPIPGRQLRIVIANEDAARTNEAGGLAENRRHLIAVMQGRIQRDDVGERRDQRQVVRVCLERHVADFPGHAERNLAYIHADQLFWLPSEGSKQVS